MSITVFTTMDSSLISLKQAVETFVQSALPNLSESIMTGVVDIIIAGQPSELQDLMYFKEEDFLEKLTKMQARKLFCYIEQSFSKGNPRAEVIEICEKPAEVKTVSTSEELAIERLNTAQTEPFNVSQLSIFTGKNWADDFKIPYEKFPPNVLKHCRQGSQPNPEERSHIVRILAYEISKLAKKPGKKNLEIIASKLIKQYPKSFQDVIGDKPFGNGYASFLRSLTLRFNNQNRPKRSSLTAKLPETQEKAKKRCINFQPENLPNEETENTQKEKQTWLQTHFHRKEQNEDEVIEAMSTTFVSQRLTINTVKLVEEVVKEWPYLTLTNYLLAHFNTAMQPYEIDWTAYSKKKIPELLWYLKSKITSDTTSECNSIAILQLLVAYFKEVNTIVEIYKDCDSIEIINKDTCPVTPFIAVFGTKSAVVFIERKCFTQYITPDDALKMWFASYFVFNLVYPEECKVSMEFIQRGLIGLPADSSNSKRGSNRILKLLKDLTNYKNMWTIID